MTSRGLIRSSKCLTARGNLFASTQVLSPSLPSPQALLTWRQNLPVTGATHGGSER